MKFEDIGPLQILVIGFDADAKFEGLIIEELERLISHGTIRVIDLRFVARGADGDLLDVELEALGEEERASFGQVIDTLRQAAGEPADAGPGDAIGFGDSIGLGPAEIERFVSGLEPGQSVGIMLFEHTWATRLKAAVRGAGGIALAQGMLTPEAALMVGAEVSAIAEAEATIELAAAVSGAAMLDAAAVVAEAEDIKAAAAVDAIRAMIAAEIIVDTAATAALEALVEADLISAAAVDAAAQEVIAAAEETNAALDAMTVGAPAEGD